MSPASACSSGFRLAWQRQDVKGWKHKRVALWEIHQVRGHGRRTVCIRGYGSVSPNEAGDTFGSLILPVNRTRGVGKGRRQRVVVEAALTTFGIDTRSVRGRTPWACSNISA